MTMTSAQHQTRTEQNTVATSCAAAFRSTAQGHCAMQAMRQSSGCAALSSLKTRFLKRAADRASLREARFYFVEDVCSLAGWTGGIAG